MPRLGILFRLARAVIPDQAVPFGAQRGRHADGVLVHDLAPVIALFVDGTPLDLAFGERVAKVAVLGSSPGEHREEPALVLMDVGHVLGAGQFAVNHIEEVWSSDQATEEVPGGDMGFVVHHIAAGDLEIERNRAVPGHREDEEQLLEVGPMVLVVTPGDRQPRSLAPFFFLGGFGIGTVQGYRGGVIVQLVQFNLELSNYVGRKGQDHGGDVALKQPIETAPGAVVVEGWELVVGEPECRGIEPRGPFPDAVERLAGEQRVFEQEHDANRGSDPAASIGAWEVGAEKLFEAHPFEQSIDDRQGADSVRAESPPLGTSDPTGAWRTGWTRNMTSLGFFHLCCS